MWEWLAALPLMWQIILSILVLMLILVISIYGNMFIGWGRAKLGIGNKNKKSKRSCSDCIIILMSKREKFETQFKLVENSILKEQMNYTEQKITQIQSLFLNKYSSELSACKNNGKIDNAESLKQYRLFYGLLKDGLVSIKDELRRSFKENGFYDLDTKDFELYLKSKTKTLISIITQHMMNFYPNSEMCVSMDTINTLMNDNLMKLKDIISDVFINGKNVNTDAKRQMDSLTSEFSEELDRISGESND